MYLERRHERILAYPASLFTLHARHMVHNDFSMKIIMRNHLSAQRTPLARASDVSFVPTFSWPGRRATPFHVGILVTYAWEKIAS